MWQSEGILGQKTPVLTDLLCLCPGEVTFLRGTGAGIGTWVKSCKKETVTTTKTEDYKNHFKKHLSQHRCMICLFVIDFQRPTTHGLCWWLSLLPSRQNNLLWIEKIGWYICINDISLWHHYDINHVLHSQAWTETCRLYHIIEIHRVYETKIQERQVEDRI